MPRHGWIDKGSAKTFVLVHRPQNDPKIHDEEVSSMVFAERPGPRKKIKTKGDLEDELGLDPSSIRDNEGEAAAYGIYYDDTDYDYMQHIRDIGTGSEGYFVEAPPKPQASRKGKGKQTLEDALKETRLDDDISVAKGGPSDEPAQLLDDDILPSKALKKATYQDQQDVPDALTGLQPDMDPRLREVLEALDDEAYIEDEDETFAELAKDQEEISLDEFQASGEGYDDNQGEFELDDGWETDDTTKPATEKKKTAFRATKSEDIDMAGVSSQEDNDGGWMNEYGKFKAGAKLGKSKPAPSNSDLPSSIVTGSSMTGGRRKKRKGAMTSSTGYSMSSSSLQRTEGLTLLDDRFEQMERLYSQPELDEDEAEEGGGGGRRDNDGSASVFSSATSSRGPVRSDLDSMMDDFLGTYSMAGKKRVRRIGNKTGLEQLDEIRQGLGPAHLRASTSTSSSSSSTSRPKTVST